MATRRLKGSATSREQSHLEMRSASLLSNGSDSGSHSSMRSEISLEWFDADDIVRAVIVVFDRYDAGRMEPGADRWISDTDHHRPKMIADVKSQWRDIALQPEKQVFPYSEAYVCQIWASYRRYGKQNKSAIRQRYFRDPDPKL